MTSSRTFEDALQWLRAGRRVARKGWNGKGMFLYLVQGSAFSVSRPPLSEIFSEGAQIQYRPHIDIKDAEGFCGVWTPSQADLFATDWESLEFPASSDTATTTAKETWYEIEDN